MFFEFVFSNGRGKKKKKKKKRLTTGDVKKKKKKQFQKQLSCFASLGLEHSIANMFIFALAQLTGQGASLAGAATNLLVVSLGNVVGAAAVLAVLLKLGHGSR